MPRRSSSAMPPAPEPQAVPSTSRTGRPPPRSASPSSAPTELSLAISRLGVGLELSSPLKVGPLTLREMTASLPGLRFPVDVSGGVARFRSRRGLVERVLLEAPRAALEAWAAPKLRGVVGVGTPRVMLFVRRGGATVGLVDATTGCALAFEVELDAEGEDVALSVHDARGAGLGGPPTVLAVRALAAALGDMASRSGARFVVRNLARALACHVYPDRGARVPDASGLLWSTARGHDDLWLFIAQRGDAPAEPTAAAVVAREGSVLARDADDAAVALDLEKARTCLVEALERAPSHRELVRRLAEIDQALGASASAGGSRAEAALATLRDGRQAPPPLLLAQLLRDTGDHDAALAAFERAGEAEPVGPLAALAFEAAAALARDPIDALLALDRAVARAPSFPGPRWTRLATRLSLGRVADATADAEHLEAQATGARARHAIWVRAGEAFRQRGFEAQSATLFERALRYAPRDIAATAGLGSALVAVGKVARGAELLTQAVALAEASGREAWDAHLHLADVLAEKLDDRPAAIARVRAIPARAKEALRARGSEGRWRAQLGDLAGAGVAFAQARDLVEARHAEMSISDIEEALAILLEAAHLEAGVKGDWLAAERHLGAALRVAPRDPRVRTAFREAAAKETAVAPTEPPGPMTMPPLPDAAPSWMRDDLPADPPAETSYDDAVDHARVDELTRKLHGDPTDDAVVDELATCLLRLGRTHELFALLAARLDEAAPERRARLVPRQREVLARLEEDARAVGRADEAALYAEMRLGL